MASDLALVASGTHARMVETLEHAMSAHDHHAGDRFAAADVYVASAVQWGTSVRTLPRRDALDAYLGRTWDYPAAARAHEIDDALVRKVAGQT